MLSVNALFKKYFNSYFSMPLGQHDGLNTASEQLVAAELAASLAVMRLCRTRLVPRWFFCGELQLFPRQDVLLIPIASSRGDKESLEWRCESSW
jgi:hypothetical protein